MKAKLGNVEIEGTADEFRQMFVMARVDSAPVTAAPVVMKPRRSARKHTARKWTAGEESRLLDAVSRDNSPKTIRVLARKLGRTIPAIQNRRWLLLGKKGWA